MTSSYFKNPTLRDKSKGFTHRRLQIESLENRELLSVTLADLPDPGYETSNPAYIADEAPAARSTPESGSVAVESRMTTEATVFLAKPASVRNAKAVTPSTITVNWGNPVATKTANTEQITGFKITITETKTKILVDTLDVGRDDRTATFVGLVPKTSYTITITSVGGEGTSSDKATLKITASTANFPLVSVKASKMTLTSATLTITDKDKVTAFQNGQPVKSYTIQYALKEKTIDWSQATEMVVDTSDAATVIDTKKCTITLTVDKLAPGTQYSFRIIATYKEGETDLRSEGKASNGKTTSLPAVTVSKTYFSVIGGDNFAIGANCKVANYAKLNSQIKNIEISLSVSTSTTINKADGKLIGAASVSDPKIYDIDSKGVFSLDDVSLQSIAQKLDVDKVLGVKTLGLQLVVKFTFVDGTTADLNSKVGKITLPVWYVPA